MDKDNVNSSGVASEVGFNVGFEGLEKQFKMSCGKGQGSKGTSKGRPKRCGNKDKGVRHSPKVVESMEKSTIENSKAMMSWKRLTTRPHTPSVDMELGQKRKQAKNENKEAIDVKGEKKHRTVEKEQDAVSTMGVVEVARQPCWA